jgi:hypothetical protein
VLSRSRSLLARHLFEYASAAKSPARLSRLLLHLLVRFSVSKQLFAPSKTMADAPTDIDGVFAFKRQNVAKERFYSVVHLPPPLGPQSSRIQRRVGPLYSAKLLTKDEARRMVNIAKLPELLQR